MADFSSSEGASAANGAIVDYSGNAFSYSIDGQFDVYYVTRLADASDNAVASLTGNTVTLFGSGDADQAFVNAFADATENAHATSNDNNWYIDLGDGDDVSGINTLAAGIGAATGATVRHDSAMLLGGAGADTLQATHYLSSLDGAFVSIEQTSRFIDGGEGLDSIYAELTIDDGREGFTGGSAVYFYNSLYVDAGADGANIFANNILSSVLGGSVSGIGNSFTLMGGRNWSYVH